MPPVPIRPRTMQNTLLAGVVGAMIGLGTGFLIEYLDDTVKSPQDVEQVAGLGVMGAIGRFQGEELVTSADPLSPIAESFRTLRTNIRYSGVDEPIRSLLVTSPGPVEGKSVVVANLATAMAQADLKVVVLDGDMRRPRQHEIFGISQSPGLTYALLDGHLARVLKGAQVGGGLFVIPAGEKPPNPAEILGSQRMEELVGELGGLADIIVIDSPPVLPVTDAAVLGRTVDAVLLVVEVGRTRQAELCESVEALRHVGANVIGIVLNQIPARGGYYYQYYHSYDGYYGRDGEKGKRGVVRRLLRR